MKLMIDIILDINMGKIEVYDLESGLNKNNELVVF